MKFDLSKNIKFFNNKEDFCRFGIRCFTNVACVLVGIILGLYIIMPHWASIVQNSTIFDVNKLNKEDLKILNLMVAHNKLYTSDFVVGRLIEFYEILVQTLIGLFALFGFLGFMYIKYSHRRDITEELHDYMNSHTGKLIFQDLLKDYIKEDNIKPLVEETFNNERNSGGDIAALIEDTEILKEQVENLLSEQTNMSERIDSMITSNNDSEIIIPEDIDNNGE